MDETEFNRLADAMLKRIEDALDAQALDLEVKPGGVIEVAFDDGSRIIINRHTAAREIWIAARSGGFHFRPENGRWVGTRDGAELMEALGRLVSGQAGRPIAF
ncbi:MAG: iron donor protein CyaY [Pseudomonadota bacterium]|jgi:CyaY protein